MKDTQNKRILKVAIDTVAITLLALLLSKTLLYSFSSMLALKSSIEVKDYEFSDLYYAVADKSIPQKISDDVVLVAVDGLTRGEITDLLYDIKAAGPKAIGIDILFEYQYAGDSSLIAVTSDSAVIMAEFFDPEENNRIHKSYFCDSSHLARGGMVNLEEGVARNYRSEFRINDSAYLSFAAEVAQTAGYDIGHHTSSIYFPTIDFWTLEHDMFIKQYESCAEIMKDKIVLVGDAANRFDIHQTPVGPMSGLKIQAATLETIVGNKYIHHFPDWLNWVVAILSCLIVVLRNIYLTNKKLATGNLLFRLAQIFVLYLFFWTGCELFVKYNICIDFAPSLSMIALGLLAYDIYFGFAALYKKIITKRKHT